MDAWVTFWTIACIIFFTAFYVLVLAVMPLGGRDMLRLFRQLSRGSERRPEVTNRGSPPRDGQ